MKWQKFEQILTENPWIQYHIGSPWLRSLPANVPADEARKQLREYVRVHVDYIAFRPFADLNFNWTNREEYTEVPHPTYRNMKFWRGTRRDLSIRFHIEGPDQPFERLRYVDSHVGKEMVSIAEWHSKYWAKQGCALRIGAVVAIESQSNDVTKFSRQRLEIYPFPADWDLAGMMGFAA